MKTHPAFKRVGILFYSQYFPLAIHHFQSIKAASFAKRKRSSPPFCYHIQNQLHWTMKFNLPSKQYEKEGKVLQVFPYPSAM